MNKAFELIAVLMISLVIGVQSLVAASVKGRILQMGPTGELTPVAGATLTTYTNKSGRSYPVTTDSEGMFYLTAPAGAYVLEVWTSRDPHQPPQTFPIKVTDPFTDIQSIILAGRSRFLDLKRLSSNTTGRPYLRAGGLIYTSMMSVFAAFLLIIIAKITVHTMLATLTTLNYSLYYSREIKKSSS